MFSQTEMTARMPISNRSRCNIKLAFFSINIYKHFRNTVVSSILTATRVLARMLMFIIALRGNRG